MSNFFKDCNMYMKALCNMTSNCCCFIFRPLIRYCTNWCQSIPCAKNLSSNLNTNIENSPYNSNSNSLYETFNDDDMMDLL